MTDGERPGAGSNPGVARRGAADQRVRQRPAQPGRTGGRESVPCVLAINGGSSSLKFAVFTADEQRQRLLSGRVERIGREDAWLKARDRKGMRDDRAVVARDHAAAVAYVLAIIDRELTLDGLVGVGHRIVHGGTRFPGPVLITEEVLDDLRRLAPLDPEHLPGELAVIEALEHAVSDAPQVACFDTAFHRTLPPVARIVPVPRRYWAHGIRRYGFHGLAYAALMEELSRQAPEAARGRVVLAHLGSGASLAAVRDGRCVETTMGLSPASGVVMGTRTGDVDPALAAVLARAEGMTPEAFLRMCSHESGLLGVSETSADVRDLIAAGADDPRAAEAIELFCYRVRTAIGGLAAALGGLDGLVFSGGIGENEAAIRAQVCAPLGHLGIELDPARNAAGGPLVSADGARVETRVIPADEEAMIARETVHVMRACAAAGS